MTFTITDRRHHAVEVKPAFYGLTKIVSGGQTGADMAGLDVARKLGLDHGGWVPAGRMNERGVIPIEYQMRACLGGNTERTALNVRDSDATLIFTHCPDIALSGGSKQTRKFAAKAKKPSMHVRLPAGHVDVLPDRIYDELRTWLQAKACRILNVAGSRESKEPGIYEDVTAFLTLLLSPEEA